MKKILIIVTIISLMTSAFCVLSFMNESQEEPKPQVDTEPIDTSLGEIENSYLGTWITLDGDNGGFDYYSASLFGEGSPKMIVALLALTVSVVSICLLVVNNKKKTDSATDKEDNE